MDNSVDTQIIEDKSKRIGKRFLFITAYFACTPLLLFFIILYILFLSHEKSGSINNAFAFNNQSAHYQALPDQKTVQSQQVLGAVDARERMLEEFLARYKSPLLPHAQYLIDTADKYNLDYRLLPAIAMQESNLCKKVPKAAKFNCWGFGIYGKKRTGFESYEEAIDTVASTLAEKYAKQGLNEPHEIMTKYTPNSNGSWAEGVTFFMDKIHASL